MDLSKEKYEILNINNLLESVDFDYDFVVGLLNIYLSNTPLKISEMEKLYKNTDKEKFCKIAHFLKGSVVSIGECELSNNLKKLQLSEEEIDSTAFEEIYNLVKRQLDIFNKDINKFIEFAKELKND